MNHSHIAFVVDRIAQAAARSGRNHSAITLVAAVKGRSVFELKTLLQADITTFGENKAQELIAHRNEFTTYNSPASPAGGQLTTISWHFIGHLQTNKINQVVPHIALLHSLDRIELARALEQKLNSMGKTLDVLVEVNSAQEPQKWGVAPERLPRLLRSLRELRSLKVRGLMTMGKQTENLEESRQCFRQMKKLFDQCKSTFNVGFDTLSMGMSRDFEIAIEEGATMVRIGTALFS